MVELLPWSGIYSTPYVAAISRFILRLAAKILGRLILLWTHRQLEPENGML